MPSRMELEIILMKIMGSIRHVELGAFGTRQPITESQSLADGTNSRLLPFSHCLVA